MHQSPVPRRKTVRAVVAGTAAAVALPLLSVLPAGTEAVAGFDDTVLQREFADAAAEHGVPESVLLGVAYLQSRWDGHGGTASVSGGYGPMHLTDAHTALARAGGGEHHGHGPEDPRGDDWHPLTLVPEPARHPGEADHPGHREVPGTQDMPAGFQTVDRAAELTGLDPEELRTAAAANVRGGAALLARAQEELGEPLSDDPADWYGAVAAYAGAGTREAAEVFADDVFEVINSGARHTTGEGQRVALDPLPVRPRTGTAAGLDLPPAGRTEETECPPDVSCEWLPAPHQQLTDEDGEVTGHGNHDRADRPRSQSIDYIVIHDTEGYWDTVLKTVQDPASVSWHYSLRSSDGHIAQHVHSRDVAWHSGNWYLNTKSIGLEHEGFLTRPDAWYTEAMYRSSARLVRYLAQRHGIPLDRHHIIGHDNVPGPVNAAVSGMHTDPGPYWDWARYFGLLGAPFEARGGQDAELVIIRPDYGTHRPPYSHCHRDDPGRLCDARGSGAVRLRVRPDHDAELIRDPGTHPGGDGRSSTGVNDLGARASTGQQFAVAGREGEWTAIWFHGQRAWFHNPPDRPSAVPSQGLIATPRKGLGTVPVYGRAYPEEAAYPEGVPYQEVSPLVYEIAAGQRYAVGRLTDSEYYSARESGTSGHRVVRGEPYYQIQVGHRIGFVRAADVDVRRARY
ncbi:N-acetylmuramoyl-L-alanine amidase [Streptomyces sodiiphilus]|uniref:N-acetylmuramoyl-L-alanine amidase n=1 Tax=Streptomyces sodiiphilus TaxID=226217 RepID=A0ABN2P1G4_9ACTN